MVGPSRRPGKPSHQARAAPGRSGLRGRTLRQLPRVDPRGEGSRRGWGPERDGYAMRILHVSPGYYPVVGGSEVHIQELSERLSRRGHDVTVLTTQAAVPGGTTPLEMINGVRVLR